MALTALTSSASAMIGLFDPDKDILIAQFDNRPDADDIHSQAALGSMLLHPDLAGVEVYAVMGAVGTQNGTFIDSTSLFNQIFGPEGSENWTDAWNDWNTSVTRIKNKARTVLDAGGHVWVQEAGQSNITADWIQALLDDGVASATIKSNVTVVQHSEWNQNKTASQDLTFVKDRTTYVKIDDGNHPNSTPDWHLDDTTFMNEVFAGKALPGPEALWLLANQIIVDSGFSAGYSSIDEGGVDFSDCVENWYIFGIGSNADTVRKFWDRYVIDPSAGSDGNSPAVDAFIEDNGIVAYEVESMDPVSPEWTEASSISGFSGDGYFVGQIDRFNQGGNGIIAYPVYITSSGRYQLNWRSRITVGSNNTEHNDSFVRMVNVAGNPVTPVSNDNSATGSWYKAYMNQDNTWSWETANKDNDPHSLSWNLEADTLYYFELSVRSQGHAVDRIVLWDHNRHSLANKKNGKGPNASSLNNLSNSEFRLADAQNKTAYIHEHHERELRFQTNSAELLSSLERFSQPFQIGQIAYSATGTFILNQIRVAQKRQINAIRFNQNPVRITCIELDSTGFCYNLNPNGWIPHPKGVSLFLKKSAINPGWRTKFTQCNEQIFNVFICLADPNVHTAGCPNISVNT